MSNECCQSLCYCLKLILFSGDDTFWTRGNITFHTQTTKAASSEKWLIWHVNVLNAQQVTFPFTEPRQSFCFLKLDFIDGNCFMTKKWECCTFLCFLVLTLWSQSIYINIKMLDLNNINWRADMTRGLLLSIGTGSEVCRQKHNVASSVCVRAFQGRDAQTLL